jgi:dTMP kinase
MWAVDGLVPALTVVVDVPAAEGRRRRGDTHDRLESESLDFHQRVRQTFLAQAEADPDRYLVLDARQTPDELAAAIRARVADLLAGLPLQTLSQADRPPAAPAGAPSEVFTAEHAGPHHPHAQTGSTPQLHP